MATGNKRKTISAQSPANPSRWKNILLALTLVPIIAGVVLIAAWALDISLVGALESQVFIGLLFILLGFTLSNLAQGKWGLFAGWLLLTIADTLLLLVPALPVQIVALALAVIGLALLAVEFYRQYQRQTRA
jgi:uncharacterized membrane-anchored protein